MAIVQFKYGSGALPSIKNSGALYLNQYNKKIYVDLDESNRICVGDFQKVNWTSSSTITSPENALKNLTVKDNNILYLTYDSKTGHSALWYYDDSVSPAQFREIISSESISIIASEFDRVDKKFADLDSELESLTDIVDTKVSQEELETYNFATEEEATALAIAAIANVQGDATNDTSETLTIQGTRKYVDSKVQEVNSNIETLGEKVNGIESTVNTLEETISGHTTDLASITETLDDVSDTVNEAHQTAEQAKSTASEAKNLATSANTTATSAAGKADEAYTKAESAETVASEASTLSSSAADKADEAYTKAESAESAANEAKDLATAAQTTAESAAELVETKISQEDLEAYNFATEDEAAAFAIAAISNVQGNEASDTLDTLTIHGTRKYANSLNVATNTRLDAVIDGDIKKNTDDIKTIKDQINGLSGSGFATTGYVDQKAASALSSAKGTVNDSKDDITIYGARKYAAAIETDLNSKITSVGNSLSALDLLVDGVSKDLKQTDGTATQAKEAADKANRDLVGVKTTAEGAASTAADALTAADTAQQTADSKTTLQAVKDYISEGQYTTVPAVTTAISNTEKAIKEYADGKDQEINTRVSTLEQNIGNLSNIMNFLGVLTIDLNHEATTNPVTINGKSHTAVAGDVVIDNAGEEFVFDGSKWQQIGNITAETAAISDLQTRMGTAEDEIDDLQTRMETAEDEIDYLQDHMAEAESNLETINTTIGTKLTHSTDTLWGVLTWGTW